MALRTLHIPGLWFCFAALLACSLWGSGDAFVTAPLLISHRAARARRGPARIPTMAAAGDSAGANSVLSRLCPLLKLVANSDPTAPRNAVLETATTGFASMARLPWGSEVSPVAAARAEKPVKPLRLYEFEACPFCRRVRETATYLDLELEVAPWTNSLLFTSSRCYFVPHSHTHTRGAPSDLCGEFRDTAMVRSILARRDQKCIARWSRAQEARRRSPFSSI